MGFICRTLLVLSLFPAASSLFATETDQFTTPATPLYDIGPALSRRIVAIIEAGRGGKAPDEILFERVGRSVLASRLTKWVRRLRSADAPVTFRPPVTASIYRTVVAPLPTSFWFDAPTVNLHGHLMGTDKIDHFFQQGHGYFRMSMRLEAAGATPEEAVRAAVAHGVKQEHTYFGTRMSGVYSNADLAANYAGMKFYWNLRHPVRIGERILPPLFERTEEGWRLRPGVDPSQLLVPFLSPHLDESLNPSRFALSRRSIRRRLRERCVSWTAFYADRLDWVAKSPDTFATRWFGEEYGHWLPPKDEVSMATECADTIRQRKKATPVPLESASLNKRT